jgi:hypothetical protein
MSLVIAPAHTAWSCHIYGFDRAMWGVLPVDMQSVHRAWVCVGTARLGDQRAGQPRRAVAPVGFSR